MYQEHWLASDRRYQIPSYFLLQRQAGTNRPWIHTPVSLTACGRFESWKVFPHFLPPHSFSKYTCLGRLAVLFFPNNKCDTLIYRKSTHFPLELVWVMHRDLTVSALISQKKKIIKPDCFRGTFLSGQSCFWKGLTHAHTLGLLKSWLPYRLLVFTRTMCAEYFIFIL